MQARECAAYFEKLWKEERDSMPIEMVDLTYMLHSVPMLSSQLLQEVDRFGEFNASLARVIIKIYGIRTMLYLMFIMALQIIVSQVYSVYLVQKALSCLSFTRFDHIWPY